MEAFVSHQSPVYSCYPMDSPQENHLGASFPRFHQHQLGLQPLGIYNAMATPSSTPATPVYTKPNPFSSQLFESMAVPTMPPTLYSNGPGSMMTPTASPRAHPLSLALKPAMTIETTDLGDCGSPFLPSTPQLSTFGGSIGSPCDVLQTPVNPMFSGFDVDGLQPDFDIDGFSIDLSVCSSPPMTPGM